MNEAYLILLSSAAAIGFFHTAIGIDHSLPFVVLAKTRKWSLSKTLFITAVCGSAHVLSSILVAALGMFLGIAGSKLMWVEQTRGSWAAWILVGFGLAYSAAAFFKSRLSSLEAGITPHSHHHLALSSTANLESLPARRLMPALFIIFALGPCEALLPLLTASGISLTLLQSASVAVVFSAATLATMLLLVLFGYLGVSRLPKVELFAARLQPHTHILAGASLTLSGLFIQFFGV